MFTGLELEYLTTQRLGRLATVQPNGQPQASPVSYAWNPTLSVIDIPGHRMSSTQKFRNLDGNDRVAFVIDDVVSTDPWTVRCLEIRGRAQALTDPDQPAITLGDKAIIRLYPQRIISWGIDPDATSPRNVS